MMMMLMMMMIMNSDLTLSFYLALSLSLSFFSLTGLLSKHYFPLPLFHLLLLNACSPLYTFIFF